MSEDNPLRKTKKKKKSSKAYEVLKLLAEVKLKDIKQLKKGAKVTVSPGNFRLKGKNGVVQDVLDPKADPEDILVKVKIDGEGAVELGIEEIEGLEDLI